MIIKSGPTSHTIPSGNIFQKSFFLASCVYGYSDVCTRIIFRILILYYFYERPVKCTQPLILKNQRWYLRSPRAVFPREVVVVLSVPLRSISVIQTGKVSLSDLSAAAGYCLSLNSRGQAGEDRQSQSVLHPLSGSQYQKQLPLESCWNIF